MDRGCLGMSVVWGWGRVTAYWVWSRGVAGGGYVHVGECWEYVCIYEGWGYDDVCRVSMNSVGVRVCDGCVCV